MMGQKWATEITAWTSGKFPYQCFDLLGEIPKYLLVFSTLKTYKILGNWTWGGEKRVLKFLYIFAASQLKDSYNPETNFYKKNKTNKQNTHTHTHTHTEKLGFGFDAFRLVNSLSIFFAYLCLYVTLLDFLLFTYLLIQFFNKEEENIFTRYVS